MGKEEDAHELNGGIVCLTLVLITAAGAIAGGTLLLTVASYVGEKPEPVIVAVGVNGQDSTAYGRMPDDGNYNEEVWTIAFNYYDTFNNYLDEATGQVVGFNIDVINEVCHIANKNCELVRDWYSNAWSRGLGGPGLMSGWYDAAQGWFITYERIRTYHFTKPFTKGGRGLFLVANGNPTGFDWQDLSGRKIAFFSRWYTNPTCLARYSETITGVPLTEDRIVEKSTTQEVIDAVLNGEVDAAFVGDDIPEIVARLQQVGPFLDRCVLGGSSLMVRKDSHLPNWWNPAWRKLLNSPKHEELCDRIDNLYGMSFGQTSRDVCLTR